MRVLPAVAVVLCAGAVLPLSFAGPLRWLSTSGPLVGQQLISMSSDGAMVAAAGPRGVFVSSTGGRQWQDITPGLPADDIVDSALVHRGVVFAVLRSGRLMRHDAGLWADITAGTPGSFARAASDQGVLYYLGNPFGADRDIVFRSLDLGNTWESVAIPEESFPGAIFSVNGTLFLDSAFGGGFLVSLDQGRTWHTPLGEVPPKLINAPLPSAGLLIVPGDAAVYRSADGGRTWSTTPSSGFVRTALQTGLASSGAIIVGTQQQGEPTAVRSIDGGRSWARADAGLPRCVEGMLGGVTFSDGRFVIATAVGAFVSLDGLSWTSSSHGLEVGVAASMAYGERLIAQGRSSPRVFSLTPSGWAESSAGIDECAQPLGLLADQRSVYFGTAFNGVYGSTDGGATFAPFNAGLPSYNGTGGQQFREVSHLVKHQGRIVAGTGFGTEFFNQQFQISGGGMIRLNTAGTGWTRINRGFPIIARNVFNEPVYAPVTGLAQIDAPDRRLLLAGTWSAGVVRSSDVGENWVLSNTGLPRDSADRPLVISSFCQAGSAIIAGGTGFPFVLDGLGRDVGVFRSIDGGVSWSRPTANVAPFAAVNDVAWFQGVAYAGADGLYRSLDEGLTWELVPDAPAGPVADLLVEANRLFVALASGSIWEASPACYGDFTGDGFIDGFDYDAYVACFESASACSTGLTADVNGDGFVDGFDYDTFVGLFELGCD